MQARFLIILLTLLSATAFAQTSESSGRAGRSKPVIYSASSEWQRVNFKATPRLRSSTTQPTASVNAPVRMQPPASVSPVSTPDARTAETARPTTQPDALPTRTEAPATQPTNTYSANPTTRPTVAKTTPVADAPVSTAPRYIPPAPSPTGYRPAFTGDFATNRNGWKAGNKGDYHYQIGLGKYNIRKRNVNTEKIALSYVPLPPDINLNIADFFTIKLDVVADSGRIPTGGLMFGVRDSLNFSAFTLNSRGEVSIIRVANGQTFSDYMPGDFFAPGVPVDRNRNRLIVRRQGDALHFYINEREVRSSPYPFKMFSGNGIGMMTSAYWTSFQKLSVTLGP